MMEGQWAGFNLSLMASVIMLVCQYPNNAFKKGSKSALNGSYPSYGCSQTQPSSLLVLINKLDSTSNNTENDHD